MWQILTRMPFSKFKYSEKLNLCECNLSLFSETDKGLVFHWVFSPINDPRNFIPPFERNSPPNPKPSCKGFALSFYSTKLIAKTKLLEYKARRANVHKKIGTHIAKGSVNKEDGCCDVTDNEGHFNLLEYKEKIIGNKFQIDERVLDD